MNGEGGTQSAVQGGCPYCSSQYQAVFHGGACPRVKAIEYHPSGGIKRVEFHDEKPIVSFNRSLDEALNSGDGTYRP